MNSTRLAGHEWAAETVTPRMIEDARERIRQDTVRTPLVPLDVEGSSAKLFLKLENLQPTGSFKVRGVSNALALSNNAQLKTGVYTVSAGNMAQALARQARQKGIKCSVIVPENAPSTKIDGIKRYGATVIPLSFEEVWQVVQTHHYGPLDREKLVFIHPFADSRMIAGNGTVGLELIEDLPDVDSVIVPFGGGGLASGIGLAVKSRAPRVKVFATEPETAAPLARSFEKGTAEEVQRVSSFVDGIGGRSVLPEMWTLVKTLLEGSIVVSLREIANALRLLVERSRVIAEGAGAASLAAALTGKAGSGKIACIVSGGNIDAGKLIRIMQGEIP